MNIDNIRTTIESIRSSDSYYQDSLYHPCGTPACIAGHACIDAGYTIKVYKDDNLRYWDYKYILMFGDEKIKDLSIETAAADWFGFSEDSDEIDELFFTTSLEMGYDITKEKAISVLENLIETGEVDWHAGVSK